ncbi:TauD/TfdA family dioxygenase [Bradyrhizobium sp. CCGB12]|uniref:TauD/TfdA family dioxygenase n=1 Tax=Bradyrhizobium sp. CCGB12 TaxID=2949632 RepID=UPI0028127705|nr:TauD/TfdA family dioxygenase [Bradyrhizobium sp. CCGB12]
MILETRHPAVSVHPKTGERTLLLGALVQRIGGISKFVDRILFDIFLSHVTRPETAVHWDWKEVDIAMGQLRHAPLFGQ